MDFINPHKKLNVKFAFELELSGFLIVSFFFIWKDKTDFLES